MQVLTRSAYQHAATSDQAAHVLQVVLSAAAGSVTASGWDIKTICSLLQVSTACRQAVFGSGISCEVCADRDLLDASQRVGLPRLAHFCAWLPGHVSLVRKLVLSAPHEEYSAVAAEQLVSLALQLCAQQSTAAATAAAAANGVATGQQVSPAGLPRPLQRLQLRSFDSHLQLQPAALAALASCSVLTQLQLCNMPRVAPSGVPSSVILPTSLQRLVISSPSTLPKGLAASLAQLTRLTHLDLSNCHIPAASLQSLPAQLSLLKVELSDGAAAGVCLQHMSGLQELKFGYLRGRSRLKARLPTSLTALTAAVGSQALQLIPPTLPYVSHVKVGLRELDSMADLQFVFPRLQSFKVSLQYVARAGELTAAQANAVAAAISTATHISSLHLHRRANAVNKVVAPSAADSCMPLHTSVGRLAQLTNLTLTGFKVDPADMLKLTVLSKLVDLAVLECPALGDAAAAALACKQTGLRVLKLQGCGLDKPALLPALASCSGLQVLDLRGNDELRLSAETLMLLTALRQLTQLVLPAAALFETVSPVEVLQVKRAMPWLVRLECFPPGKLWG